MFKSCLFAIVIGLCYLQVVLLSSQSSDSTKSLKLPVDCSVLKAVVDYIYTDEAPDGLGECCRFLMFLCKSTAATSAT